MRLSSLKLAGFKSFAESTTLHFPENRSAIVGPNGCGKSNVIDAIRWVMGESNARQLRGGSMQDVIFAGTSQRRPVGVASVELRFDNTYGKLGGAYNAYSELSIKRQVTREGKSEYFLNGTRCRRKDITDIFLGTGLGPRSYAVIEQGMINRLVDAKPEEMRVFIEEAAGVSRYQARRKETLQHLEHTQSNLARLYDIAQELQAQIKTLKRQAEQAERYQKLKNEILDSKIAVLSYQYTQLLEQISVLTQQMNVLTEQYQDCKKALEQAEIESVLLQQKIQQQLPQSEQLQTAYQTAQQQQQKIEWQLSLDEKNHQQQLKKIEQIEQQMADLSAQQRHLTEQLMEIEQQLDQLQKQFNGLENSVDAQPQLQALTTAYALKQAQQQQQEQQLHKLKAQYQQACYQVEQIEKTQTRFNQQLSQLQAQYQQCVSADDQFELEELQLDLASQQLKRDDLQQTVEQQQQILKQQQEKLMLEQQQLNDVLLLEKNLKREIEQTQKLLTNLQKHQPTADQNSVLHQLQLTPSGHTYSQWVEKLLDGWLWATCQQHALDEHAARQLLMVDSSSIVSHAVLKPITDWLIAPLHPLWTSVYIAQDLIEAKQYLADLTSEQSIVTQDGYWLAQDWQINFNLDQAPKTQGYLAYQSHLHVLESQYQQVQTDIEPLQQQVKHSKHVIEETQSALHDLINHLKAISQQIEIKSNKQIKLQSQIEHQQVQSAHVKQQIQQIQQLHMDDQHELDALHLDRAALQIQLQALEPQLHTLQQETKALEEDVNHHNQVQQQRQQQRQKLQLDLQQQHAKQALIKQEVTFKTERLTVLFEQKQGLERAVASTARHIAQQQLQLERINTEVAQHHQTWMTWQVHSEKLQKQQVELNTQRSAQQAQESQWRDQLEQLRLKWQECSVQQKHVIAQIEALGQQPKVAEISLLEYEKLQTTLSTAEQQLSRLGGVNLAAFEELQTLQLRYDELNHQIEDLEKTIEHLQSAMKSIDQETKHLFMKVFDQINQELQELFPKIFSGGEASLTLESDWQSGVRLMARPPGKRNSTLALLSGGEKALTALALVFAIFRLNPAPFCVLDEVDAPLDDANVDRFCNLVKELSQQVQFIYITHNKLAMTMATDLLGVTMPEAGSSRLVAVSLAQAEAYTA